MYNYFIYIIIIIIMLFLLYKAYFKIKFKFWSIQPVNHYHKFYNLYKKNEIINYNIPEINKYTDLINIETFKNNELTSSIIADILYILSNNYLFDNINNIYYKPKKNNFLPYLNNNDKYSLISVYNHENILIDNNNKLIRNKKPLGIVTSKHMNLFINNKYYNTFYVDFLVVDLKHRKKNIAPKLIQTIFYKQRLMYPNIYINVFKREDDQNFIKPITKYISYGINLNKMNILKKISNINLYNFNINITSILIDKKNFINIKTILKEQINYYDLLYIPSTLNLLDLIMSNNYYIYSIVNKDNINISIGYFIFKNNACTYNGEKSLSLIGSYYNDNILDEVTFKYLFLNLLNNIKKIYKIIIIEDISKNHLLLELFNKDEIFLESNTSYYFYNFISEKFNNKKILLLT